MKKLALFLTLTLTSSALGQSPQAPDKSPPQVVATPQSIQYQDTPQAVAIPQVQYVPRVIAVAVPQVAYCGVNVGVAHCNQGFVQQRFVQQRFVQQRFSGNGNGVSISAVDRKGTQVVANGANKVKIQRGLLGRINGAKAK